MITAAAEVAASFIYVKPEGSDADGPSGPQQQTVKEEQRIRYTRSDR